MRIGLLALQGDFLEHRQMFEQLGAEAVEVRLPEHLAQVDALVIPGGESTTIGKLATTYGLLEPMREFGRTQPIWGTCAGMIFLAKDIGRDQPLLGLMDITVNRNAFGRQTDSFETDLDIPQLGETPLHAVFIRAPLVAAIDESAGVDVLATLEDGGIVAVQQGHWLATAFHPELTDDVRMHEYFMRLVSQH